MALTFTARGSHGAATNLASGGTASTGSFTPSANALLLGWVSTQGGPGVASNGIASISGHGTWSRLDDGTAAGNDQLIELWACITSGAPSAATVTITNTTQTKIRRAISVIEVAGIDETAALSAIVAQVVERNQGTAGLTGDVTLAAFGDATLNGVAIGVCSARYQEDTVFDSPLVEAHDVATGTELMRLATAHDVGEDTTPGFSWGANNRTWRAIAVEVVDPDSLVSSVEVAVATATEVDTAQALNLVPAGSATLALATATTVETASPLALAASGAATVALAAGSETDTAQPLVLGVSTQLGIATASEADAAQPLDLAPAGSATLSVATATETNTASSLALVPSGSVPVALASAAETDTASPLVLSPAGAATLALATGSDTETAQPLTLTGAGAAALSVATGTESDTAQPLALTPSGSATLALGTASETDTAQPLVLTVATPGAIALATATEVETANPLALAVGTTVTLALAAAVEEVFAQPLTLLAEIVGPNPATGRTRTAGPRGATTATTGRASTRTRTGSATVTL